MIESGGTRSEIGRQLHQAVLDGKFDKGWTIIEDSFGAKKTGTLYKRARALWNFFVWSKQWQAATDFQWTDDLVYDYLCFARSHNKAPTHGMSLLQAFNFLNGVSAFDGYTGFSARVKGLAKILFANKRTLVQARQLKKCEVAALEDFVLGNAEKHLRFIAGYCLFCLGTQTPCLPSVGASVEVEGLCFLRQGQDTTRHLELARDRLCFSLW